MYDNINDNELIKLVKENNDSNAVVELSNRHSGIYMSMLQTYSYIPPIERQDLADHKESNIYRYAMEYDESKGMKFSSYVGTRIRFACKKLITDNKSLEFVEIDSQPLVDGTDYYSSTADYYSYLTELASEVEDKRFCEILNMRKNNEKWADIAKKFGVTHQRVHQIYQKELRRLRATIEREYKGNVDMEAYAHA